MDQVRDDCCELIVITERGAEFFDADRIVFINDWDGPEREQGKQRVAGVQVAGAFFQDVGRKQYLGGATSVSGEEAVIRFDECALPDGGDGLKLGQISRTGREIHTPDPGPDRSRADENDIMTGVEKMIDSAGEICDFRFAQPSRLVGQDMRADLDDDRGSLFKDLFS